MSEIAGALKYSSNLVQSMGRSRLPNGSTLSEMLTLRGIPFWDSFAVDIARLHVPAALSPEAFSPNIIQRIRPYMSQAKHKVKELFSYHKSQEGCSDWLSKPVFLCLGFCDYFYKDVLKPVLARLAEHQNCQAVVLSDMPWPNMGRHSNQNVLYQTIWQHWDTHVGRKATDLNQALYKIERELRAPNILSQFMRGKKPGMSKYLDVSLNWFFRVYLPRFVPHAAVAQHILENHHPNIVISADVADPRTRIYSLLGRQMGISCLDVQFGLTGDEGIEWRFLAADRVAVWGDASKEAMVTYHGVPAERITVTGSPRNDYLFSQPHSEINTKRSLLGVDNKRIILLASAYNMKQHKGYYPPDILELTKRAIFKAADATQGICLVVKPHPKEDVRETRELSGKCKNIKFVDRNSDIRDWIRTCDAFISFGSTATVDALMAGKLTICPVFPGFVSNYLFKNSGATLAPESEDEIMNVFQMVANGSYVNAVERLEPARQDFLKRYVYRPDGKAAARIAALALKMAGIERI